MKELLAASDPLAGGERFASGSSSCPEVLFDKQFLLRAWSEGSCGAINTTQRASSMAGGRRARKGTPETVTGAHTPAQRLQLKGHAATG